MLSRKLACCNEKDKCAIFTTYKIANKIYFSQSLKVFFLVSHFDKVPKRSVNKSQHNGSNRFFYSLKPYAMKPCPEKASKIPKQWKLQKGLKIPFTKNPQSYKRWKE